VYVLTNGGVVWSVFGEWVVGHQVGVCLRVVVIMVMWWMDRWERTGGERKKEMKLEINQ